MANAGLNVAYGYEEYPLYGPFPEALEIQFGGNKTILSTEIINFLVPLMKNMD